MDAIEEIARRFRSTMDDCPAIVEEAMDAVSQVYTFASFFSKITFSKKSRMLLIFSI